MQFILPALAMAAIVAGQTSECSGQLLCCNNVQDTDSSTVQMLMDSLGVAIEPDTGLVGLTCQSNARHYPIQVI